MKGYTVSEWAHDMTPNEMLLDVSVLSKKTLNKIKQTSNFNCVIYIYTQKYEM
jgi:hypothetical protein